MPLRASPPNITTGASRSPNKASSKTDFVGKGRCNGFVRNARVTLHQAKNFRYMVDDVLVSDFRLTFGWAASPGYWGLMASAAEHAHRNGREGAYSTPRKSNDVAC